MSADSFYTDVLAEAFCRIDKWDLWNSLTEAEQKELGADVAGNAENYGTYSGQDCIPDPREAEIDRLKAQHKRDLTEVEAQAELFRRSVARHNGVDQSRIYINNGEIYVSRT